MKIAAINFVMNLLWKDNSDSAGRDRRKKALKDLEVDMKLGEILKGSTDAELHEKAQQALSCFSE